MKTLPALAVLLPVLLLGACASHQGHHTMHHSGDYGQAAPAMAPATAAARTTTSQATLSSGYKKVAAPAGAAVYFVNLKNGDTVSSPVRVVFGLRGMGVAPAGIERENTGHHHLLVDVEQFDVNAPLPTDDRHRHFGAGQTEVSLELKPGAHTLQLVLGDQNHIPHHTPVMSERITVNVR